MTENGTSYYVGYVVPGDDTWAFYFFMADDAEHALEQFRSAEPDKTLKVVWIGDEQHWNQLLKGAKWNL